jgi:hypothetical protein
MTPETHADFLTAFLGAVSAEKSPAAAAGKFNPDRFLPQTNCTEDGRTRCCLGAGEPLLTAVLRATCPRLRPLLAEVLRPDDKTMCARRGLCIPHLLWVPRKAETVGTEAKTLACSASRIICALEIQDGKAAMTNKEYKRDICHTTAPTLRLTKLFAFSLRVVCGESLFASL